MELYNEIQEFGSWPADLLPPAMCLGEQPPEAPWLGDAGSGLLLDDLLEMKLDLSFLEAAGCWGGPPSPPDTCKLPATPLMDTDSFYLQQDDPIADLLCQLSPPPSSLAASPANTPPESPLHTGFFFTSPPHSIGDGLDNSTQLAEVIPQPESPLEISQCSDFSSPPSSSGDILESIKSAPSTPVKESPSSSSPVPRVKTAGIKRKGVRRGATSWLERKRVQNKEAATRYRQKKRVESEALCDETEELEKRNSQLKEKVGDLTREIGYLRKLMKEMQERASAATANSTASQ